MGAWIKYTNENGQDIYANLENATTIFRDEGRHRGTVIEFLGSHDAVVVRETPDQNPEISQGGKSKLRTLTGVCAKMRRQDLSPRRGTS